MENKSYDIEDVKKLLGFILALGNTADKIGSTSGPVKWGHLTMLLPELMALPSIQWKEIGEQIKDMDAAERQELLEFFKSEFDLASDELEQLLESAISMVKLTADTVLEWVEFGKACKAFHLAHKKA